MTNNQLHMLIADDHLIVRQGVEFVTSELFDNIHFHHASTLAQVSQILSHQTIDILVLDAQFPDGVSLDIIPTLRKNHPNLKILVLTSFDEATFALKFLDAGANGFVGKLTDEQTMESALRDIVTKGYFYTPLTEQLLSLQKLHPNISNPFHQLSDRELEVAKLLAKGLGILEIANIMQLKQNTISTFKKRIMEKLQVHNIVELAEMVNMHFPN